MGHYGVHFGKDSHHRGKNIDQLGKASHRTGKYLSASKLKHYGKIIMVLNHHKLYNYYYY